MINACENANISLIADILRRYPVQQDQIFDENGNSLVIIASMRGNNKLLYLLMQKGFDVNLVNYDGNSALHFAMDGKFLKCIEILINFGADEEIENNLGQQPWELM